MALAPLVPNPSWARHPLGLFACLLLFPNVCPFLCFHLSTLIFLWIAFIFWAEARTIVTISISQKLHNANQEIIHYFLWFSSIFAFFFDLQQSWHICAVPPHCLPPVSSYSLAHGTPRTQSLPKIFQLNQTLNLFRTESFIHSTNIHWVPALSQPFRGPAEDRMKSLSSKGLDVLAWAKKKRE